MGELDDDADLVAFVVSTNLRRRHLTDDQRAMVAEKLATRKKGGAHIGASRAKAAEMLNVNPRSLQSIRKVRKGGAPELVKAMEQGEIAISAAAEVAKLPAEEQREIVTAGPKAVAKAAQKIRETKAGASDDRLTLLRARAEKNGLRIRRRGSDYHLVDEESGSESIHDSLDVVEGLLDSIEGKRAMAFSTACGMPISNNSAAWLAAHPGKTMEDFEGELPPVTGACAVAAEPEASAPAEPASEPVETESDVDNRRVADFTRAFTILTDTLMRGFVLRDQTWQKSGPKRGAAGLAAAHALADELERHCEWMRDNELWRSPQWVTPTRSLNPDELLDAARPSLDVMDKDDAREFADLVDDYLKNRPEGVADDQAEAAVA